MPTQHTVRQGETLSSIALRHGFRNWKLVRDHPGNRKLWEAGRNENLLFPGDVLTIPDLEPKAEKAATGQIHAFSIEDPKNVLKLELRDFDGTPLKDRKYVLEVEGARFEGRTDDQGRLEHEIDVRATSGRLTVEFPNDTRPESFCWDLQIGCLDPVEEMPGVQQRLANLGFLAGPITGDLDDATIDALRECRIYRGLEWSKPIDAQTLEEIKKLHGG